MSCHCMYICEVGLIAGIGWDPQGVHKQVSIVSAIKVPQDLAGEVRQVYKCL